MISCFIWDKKKWSIFGYMFVFIFSLQKKKIIFSFIFEKKRLSETSESVRWRIWKWLIEMIEEVRNRWCKDTVVRRSSSKREKENLIKGKKKKGVEKVSLRAYIWYFIWANCVFVQPNYSFRRDKIKISLKKKIRTTGKWKYIFAGLDFMFRLGYMSFCSIFG